MPSERLPGTVFEAAGWQRRARRLLPAASTANRFSAFMPLRVAPGLSGRSLGSVATPWPSRSAFWHCSTSYLRRASPQLGQWPLCCPRYRR
jgi:hypothetical protein